MPSAKTMKILAQMKQHQAIHGAPQAPPPAPAQHRPAQAPAQAPQAQQSIPVEPHKRGPEAGKAQRPFSRLVHAVAQEVAKTRAQAQAGDQSLAVEYAALEKRTTALELAIKDAISEAKLMPLLTSLAEEFSALESRVIALEEIIKRAQEEEAAENAAPGSN